MAEEIKSGDWVKFKSSGFVNEGKVTKVTDDGFGVEVPNGPTKLYVSITTAQVVSKIDSPEEA